MGVYIVLLTLSFGWTLADCLKFEAGRLVPRSNALEGCHLNGTCFYPVIAGDLNSLQDIVQSALSHLASNEERELSELEIQAELNLLETFDLMTEDAIEAIVDSLKQEISSYQQFLADNEEKLQCIEGLKLFCS